MLGTTIYGIDRIYMKLKYTFCAILFVHKGFILSISYFIECTTIVIYLPVFPWDKHHSSSLGVSLEDYM